MSESIYRKAFWTAVFERAVSAGAAAVASVWVVAPNAFAVDWKNAVGIFLGAAVFSTMKSLTFSHIGSDGGPSLSSAETVQGPPEPPEPPEPQPLTPEDIWGEEDLWDDEVCDEAGDGEAIIETVTTPAKTKAKKSAKKAPKPPTRMGFTP